MKVLSNDVQQELLVILSRVLFKTEKQSVLAGKEQDVLIESLAQSVYLITFFYYKDRIGTQSDKQLYYRIIKHNISNKASHKRLHEIMSESDIPYVVLKGMASAKYYPYPHLRTMGDVDFLVNISDREKASSVLEMNGIKRVGTDDHSFHWGFKEGGVSWELHWSSPGIPRDGIVGDKVRKYLSDITEKAVFYDGCMIPSDFHHGIVLLLHTASHLTTTGVGLRHLCDWAVFENTFSGSDFEELFEKPLKDIGLWDFAKILTAISIKYLGADYKKWAGDADDNTVDLLMEDIIASGNFGKKDGQRINQAKLMRDDRTRRISKGVSLRVLLRNLSVRVKHKMPIMGKLPFLLPIGWILYGFSYLLAIVKGKRHKIRVSDTIRGAKKRSDIYKKLRLFEEIGDT